MWNIELNMDNPSRKKKIRTLATGVEPKTFQLLIRMLYHWATGESQGSRPLNWFMWQHSTYCKDYKLCFIILGVWYGGNTNFPSMVSPQYRNSKWTYHYHRHVYSFYALWAVKNGEVNVKRSFWFQLLVYAWRAYLTLWHILSLLFLFLFHL